MLGKELFTTVTSFSKSENYNSSTPSEINQKIGQVIDKYITSQVKMNVTYVGVTPDSKPESATDSLPIVGSCKFGGVYGDFSGWLKALETSIKIGYFVGPNIVKPVGSILAVNIAAPLTISQSSFNVEDYKSIWDQIGDSIEKWIKTGVNSIATFPSSLVGVGTSTFIKYQA